MTGESHVDNQGLSLTAICKALGVCDRSQILEFVASNRDETPPTPRAALPSNLEIMMQRWLKLVCVCERYGCYAAAMINKKRIQNASLSHEEYDSLTIVNDG